MKPRALPDRPFVRTGRTGACREARHAECRGATAPGCGCRCHVDPNQPPLTEATRIRDVDPG